jgi:hypothetical protein
MVICRFDKGGVFALRDPVGNMSTRDPLHGIGDAG